MDRLFEKLQQKDSNARCMRVRLMDLHINTDSVVKDLAEQLDPLSRQDPVLLHIDAASVSMQPCVSAGRLPSCWLCWRVVRLATLSFLSFLKVRSGLEELLFRLLILGCLSDRHGKLWRRNVSHLISIEVLLPQKKPNQVVPGMKVILHSSDHTQVHEDSNNLDCSPRVKNVQLA